MIKRPGFSLPETLVVLLVLGVVGASMAQVLTVQSQFIQTQEGRSVARAAARNGANVAISELRRVHADSGVVAASATSITFRIPFALGIVCGSTGGFTTVSMMPTDSVSYADDGFTGYAWRNDDGDYVYVSTGALKDENGSTSTCTGAVPSITPLPGGKLVRVQPAIAAAPAGTPLFLYRTIRYDLAASVAVPGQLGLWRTVVGGTLVEELVAPFDNTARFRFFTDGSGLAQDAVPAALSDITGIELQLVAESERNGELVPYRTAVFFKNRQGV